MEAEVMDIRHSRTTTEAPEVEECSHKIAGEVARRNDRLLGEVHTTSEGWAHLVEDTGRHQDQVEEVGLAHKTMAAHLIQDVSIAWPSFDDMLIVIARPMRKPAGSPASPQGSWDNPFPSFQGSKEDQRLAQKMGNMDLGSSGQNRSRPPGGQGQYQGRNYPPQGYPDQRRGPAGPAPETGFGASRQNGYAEPGYGPISPLREDFAPPPRSMTMPSEQRQPGPRQVDERPYNGPVGRGIPPRPSTTTGVRPPPQRTYPPAAPQQYPPGESYGGQQATHDRHESISDFYDSYYETGNNGNSGHTRPRSAGSEMPNFDMLEQNTRNLKRQQSIEEHIKPGGPVSGFQGQVKPVQSQPDLRARAQPQAAVFEMAGEAPPMPNQYQQGYNQGYPDDGYAPQNGPNGQQPGYGGFNNQPAPNGFQPPPRNGSIKTGLPSGPKAGFGNSATPPAGSPNAPSKQLSPDALPSHPTPVRPGLIPNSAPNQINTRPPPVRNYSNNSPGTPQQPSQPPGPESGAPPVVTEAELEQLRAASRNNPADLATQLILAKKLIEAAEVLVPRIPDQRARNKAREKYVMDAHKLLKKLVASGHAESMFYLADCYGRGSLGLEADNKEAFSLYQSAAKAGHAAAAYRTAVCCEIGNEEGGGTRKDPMKAIQWYKRAATLGDPPAMYKMGMIQLKGLLGQPKNPREAVGWLKRAAERADEENPHALHELGLLYEQPQGPEGSIVRDEAYSLTLFQKAAELGYKFSQFRMGCAFEYGLFNLPIDPRQSIVWYSRAAAQEEHQSELALSGWYLTGSEGVLQQSDTEAYLWARKAAMAGLAKAEYAMGYFTEVGIGIPANLEDAKRWYWRAAGMYFPLSLREKRLIYAQHKISLKLARDSRI
jgi:TPR repeat protein